MTFLKLDHFENTKTYEGGAMKQEGFTLMEIIIVLSIVGVFSAVILPSFSSVQLKAKETSLTQSTNAVQLSLESYYLTHGSYPPATAGIDGLLGTLKDAGVLSKDMVNPFTNQPFDSADTAGKIVYQLNKDKTGYALEAYSTDGKLLTTLTN